MDQQEAMDSNRAPTLNKGEYAVWKKRMSVYLLSLGCDVWNALISNYILPKRGRTTYHKDSKKNNSRAMEAILDGLPQPIKEKTVQCISTKELWVKLEKLYSVEQRAEGSLDIFENDSDDEEPYSHKEDQRSKTICKKKFNKKEEKLLFHGR